MSFPILYDKSATGFSNLGLGILSEATSCVVTEERNGMFVLNMDYPISGKVYHALKVDSLIKADASPRLKDQRFRIKKISKSINGIVSIYAEHVSYLASDLVLRPTVNLSGSANNALNQWRSAIVGSHPFETHSNITRNGNTNLSIETHENARSGLGGESGSILDVWGGEFRFDNHRIELLENRGGLANSIIAYGRNITDLNQEENIANTFTSIYPFALYKEDGDDEATLITIPGFVIHSDHVDAFANPKVLPVNFTAHFERDMRPTPAELESLAHAYMETNNFGIPKVSLRLSFVDLSKALNVNQAFQEEINLCDTLRIYFEKLGVEAEAKVNRVEWNVLLERYDSLELGEARSSLSDRIRNLEREVGQTRDEVEENSRSLTNSLGNTTFFGRYEPVARRVGDTWFRENGDVISIYVWNGLAWEFQLSTEPDVALLEAIDENRTNIENAMNRIHSIDTDLGTLNRDLESNRIAVGEAKTAAETARLIGVEARTAGQNAQTMANEARETGEAVRLVGEQAIVQGQAASVAAENARMIGEQAHATGLVAQTAANEARQTGESARLAALEAKEQAEVASRDAEQARLVGEQARTAGASAQTAANEARQIGQNAQTAANNAIAQGQAAATAAENARQAGVAATAAASTAQTQANTAIDTANTARDQANELTDAISIIRDDLTDHQSQITQQGTNINLAVRGDNLVSQINLSNDTALIQARRIHLAGESTIDNGVIGTAQIRDVAITNAKIANLAVTEARIGNAAVTNAKISNLAVDEAKIANLAVTTGKIDDLAVNTAKIGNLAVSTAKIADTAITNAKIANLAVTEARIGNAAVTNAKIANLAVNDAKIANAAVTTAKIRDLAVDNAKIGDLAVDSAKIANAAVSTAKIADAAITNAKIGALAVNTAEVANAAISNAKIADLAVNSAKIANAAVTNAKIGNLAVDNSKIANLAVDNAKIANVSAEKLNAGIIHADRIGVGSIAADKLQANSITSNQISSNAINATHLAMADFTNLATINERIGITTNISGVWGGATVGAVSGGGQGIVKPTANNEFLPLSERLVNNFSTPTSLRFSFEIWSASARAMSFATGTVTGPDATPALREVSTFNTVANAWTTITDTVTLSNAAWNTSTMFIVGIRDVTAASRAQINVRNVQVRRMNGAELIVDGSITTNQISAANVVADRITTGSMHGDRISVGTLNANRILANSLTANMITAGQMHGDRIEANTITSDHINSNTIEAEHIRSGAVESQHLAVGTIQGIIADHEISSQLATLLESHGMLIQDLPSLIQGNVEGTLTVLEQYLLNRILEDSASIRLERDNILLSTRASSGNNILRNSAFTDRTGTDTGTITHWWRNNTAIETVNTGLTGIGTNVGLNFIGVSNRAILQPLELTTDNIYTLSMLMYKPNSGHSFSLGLSDSQALGAVNDIHVSLQAHYGNNYTNDDFELVHLTFRCPQIANLFARFRSNNVNAETPLNVQMTRVMLTEGAPSNVVWSGENGSNSIRGTFDATTNSITHDDYSEGLFSTRFRVNPAFEYRLCGRFNRTNWRFFDKNGNVIGRLGNNVTTGTTVGGRLNDVIIPPAGSHYAQVYYLFTEDQQGITQVIQGREPQLPSWSPHPLELYTNNMRLDNDGLRVFLRDGDGKISQETVMRHNEFAGYGINGTQRNRIFTLGHNSFDMANANVTGITNTGQIVIGEEAPNRQTIMTIGNNTVARLEGGIGFF